MDHIRNFVQTLQRHLVLSGIFLITVISLFIYIAAVRETNSAELASPVKKGNLVLSVYGIGTVTATHSYSLKVGVIGTVVDLYVREGDLVVKGQKLVKIDRQIYTSPFSGTVANLTAMIGENVFPQVPVLTVVDLNDRYFVVSLEQQGALRVKPQQKVKVSLDSIRSETFEGLVTSVYSWNNSFLARIDVPDLPKRILPGMTADIAIVIEEHKEALTVPVSTIEANNVYMKSGLGLTVKIPVKVGIVDGAFAEILSGDLHEGDRLLIRKKMGP